MTATSAIASACWFRKMLNWMKTDCCQWSYGITRKVTCKSTHSGESYPLHFPAFRNIRTQPLRDSASFIKTKRVTIRIPSPCKINIITLFYSTKESSTWRYPRRKSATSIRFLPASCKDNTLTNPSVEAIWKYVFLSVTMLPGFRLCATKTFSVSKIFNASGAASP